MSLRAWFLSPVAALALTGGCGDAAVDSDGDAAVDSDVDEDTAVGSDAADHDAAVDSAAVDSAADTFVSLRGEHLPPEPQRGGDPAAGFAVLAGGDYVGCGVPAELYPVAERAGIFGNEPTLPGRDSELPYYLSQFTTASGVEVVGPNCFTCHAGEVAGELVLGAPGIDLDFGGFASQIAGFQSQVALLEDLLAPESYAELVRFANRLSVVAPYVQSEVAGTNPADNLAGILFAHRDRETLAWSDEPLLEPPPAVVVPVDTPPLWRMKKKSSMFYAAAGRGDHARIMMTTSTLCVDTRAEAEAIDARFGDVRAWITSLEAPAWPEDKVGAIDRALAADGAAVFSRTCAECHGTYRAALEGAGGDDAETYPNLWVPVEDVGTDDALAVGATHVATRFVDWFNGSFYGETAYLAPQRGYVPPPLDGIWATAPFLHNGSVPTLAALLDSRLRPRYWRRTGAWDATAVGLAFRESEVGHADLPEGQRTGVYDTTLLGYGNGGHTYGDELDDNERRALLEYLKTL